MTSQTIQFLVDDELTSYRDLKPNCGIRTFRQTDKIQNIPKIIFVITIIVKQVS